MVGALYDFFFLVRSEAVNGGWWLYDFFSRSGAVKLTGGDMTIRNL